MTLKSSNFELQKLLRVQTDPHPHLKSFNLLQTSGQAFPCQQKVCLDLVTFYFTIISMNKTGLIGLVLVNDKPNLEMRVKSSCN